MHERKGKLQLPYTMWITGWTGTHGVLFGLVVIWLAGCVLAEGSAPASPGPRETSVEKPDSREYICLARDRMEVEAELFELPVCIETRWGRLSRFGEEEVKRTGTDQPPTTASTTSSETAHTATEAETDAEADADSPLDNANFLSFEDWKKQNLAKAGQSGDAVAGRRPDEAAKEEHRRRPTRINNALESLGDDAEIEIEFGGFGAETPEKPKPKPTSWETGSPPAEGVGMDQHGEGEVDPHAQNVPGNGPKRDPGTTCKERFNYASFDCAATVLKTNPQCTGSSSILIENKDSYMLNECRAKNKFLILELCDDILVDTVVLANYEFFSSIFHTFRVSVADRYPAKPDQWKELGIYEARNTREVQAFAVENPLIWARYMRVELLTHYGNEFYCPLSLVRVHGTTMLEEYKHDENVARGDEPVEEAASVGDGVQSASPSREVTDGKDVSGTSHDEVQHVCPDDKRRIEALLLNGNLETGATCAAAWIKHTEPGVSVPAQTVPQPSNHTMPAAESIPVVESAVPSNRTEDLPKPTDHAANITSSATTATVSETVQSSPTAIETKLAPTSKEEQTPPESIRSSTSTQPPPPNPTTQESFFKSVNKRLQMLESNSTLSLLYIEEQSRILRDAFNKVEKRQLGKTSTFLENLNVTVLNELKQFREQYDQVWRSVVFEFEHQRIQYHQEIYALSSQLGVLADELVFQKRVSVFQSMMVIFCFVLVLFSRGTVSNYIEFPSVQNMVSRSYSFRSPSPMFGSSPTESPSSTRPASSRRDMQAHHRRNSSDDSRDAPDIAYSPPTPSSSSSEEAQKVRAEQDTLRVPDAEAPITRSRSTPPVLRGSDGIDEDETGRARADSPEIVRD